MNATHKLCIILDTIVYYPLILDLHGNNYYVYIYIYANIIYVYIRYIAVMLKCLETNKLFSDTCKVGVEQQNPQYLQTWAY